MSKAGFYAMSQTFGGIFNKKSAGFNRFHNDSFIGETCKGKDSTELSSLQNGKAKSNVDSNGAVSREGDGWPDGGYTGILEVDDEDKKTKRNKISPWQAGWNVTNAIQVTIFVAFQKWEMFQVLNKVMREHRILPKYKD